MLYYLIVVLVGAYLILLALQLSFIFLAPIAVVAGVAVAGFLVLVEFVSASSAVFAGSAPIDEIHVRPSDDPRSRRYHAYRSYFFGPVLYDCASAVRMATHRSWDKLFATSAVVDPRAAFLRRERGSLMQQVIGLWGSCRSRPGKLLASGGIVGGAVGLVLGAAAAAAFTALISVIFSAVLVVVVAVAIVSALVLRAIETVSLRTRGITLECPACHQRQSRPSYVCAHCPPHQPTLHRDLRPGSLGVLRRVCRCGSTLPTLLLSGKWKLEARCQHEECNSVLPVKAQTTKTFHVPVVAGTAAGKTVFMMAATATMETRARSATNDLTFEFADLAAKEQYVSARKALEKASFGQINPTLPSIALRAYTVYVGAAGARRRLLYLYDSAGERYERGSALAGSSFLKLTQGVVFIVDPFALDSVRRLADAQALRGVTASDVAPEDVFSRFGQGLRESLQAQPDHRLGIPVSVVITKADALLRSGGVPHPYEQWGDAPEPESDRQARAAAARRWLVDVGGQRGLVSLVENTFSRCNYFVVSALDAFSVTVRRGVRGGRGVSNDDPSAPVRWLLDHSDGHT